MVRVFNRYTAPKSLLLVAIEALLVVLSLIFAAKLRFWEYPELFAEYTESASFVFQTLTVLIILVMCFYYNDLYDLRGGRSNREQVACISQALGAGCILLSVIYFLIPGLLLGRGVLFIAVCTIFPAVTLTRAGLNRIWPLTTKEKKVLILGDGNLALTIAREFSQRDDLDIRVAGFDAPGEAHAGDVFGHRNLGSMSQLSSLVREHGISRIVVALEDRRGGLPSRDLMRLRLQGIEVQDASSTLASLTGRVWLGSVQPSWFLFSGGFHRSSITVVVKRAIDLAGGILGLALSAPLMVLVAIAIRLDSKGPIFYRQTRVGLGDRLFEILKFRSMFTSAEADSGAQWSHDADPRITRVGRILRKYRLDELPQFVNVIRGEMSLVGPRPERPVFVDLLREKIPFYDERHSVRPGVTGWAQVEYKYGSTVDDAYRKLEYDLFYLKNMSLFFDAAILIRTVRIVLYGH
jgi:sugar transferase (PEP-CTERM system associated)